METGLIEVIPGDAAAAVMMLLGQSWQETQRLTDPTVAPKKQTAIGCWNVRTMAEAMWTGQVAKEMAKYGIEMLGMSETRWIEMGSTMLQSGRERLFYSIGVDTRRAKGKRETKDHLEKDCWEREKQGRVEELECSQSSSTEQWVSVRECDRLRHLLVHQEQMMGPQGLKLALAHSPKGVKVLNFLLPSGDWCQIKFLPLSHAF